MEKSFLEVFTAISDKNNDEELLALGNSIVMSKNCLEKGFELTNILHENSDDVDAIPTKRTKKRVRHFSESDSDDKIYNDNLSNSDETDLPGSSTILQTGSGCSSGSDNDNIVTIIKKSRIQKVNRESETDTDIDTTKIGKNEGQQTRMKNKRNKIKEKFKSFINSRENESSSQSILEPTKKKQIQSSDDSNDEASSIDLIKMKIKERISSLKSTICDPDTSSDEESSQQKVPQRQKKERRSIKLTSPKPARMSAKQAMENMQKIKSESNRMLREQQVSLPYHRPKALLLKDIINRRKPAVSLDGKALPIKMNEEQLKQYVSQLEQRHKEMMVLCKSESEEEEEAEESNLNDTKADKLPYNVHTCEEAAVTNTANIQTSIDKVEIDINFNTNSQLINELGKEKYLNNEDSDDINKAYYIYTEETHDLNLVSNNKENKIIGKQDSSMELIYNDSIEKDSKAAAAENITTTSEDSENIAVNQHSENESHTANIVIDSQLISLHLDTEKPDSEINQNTENEEEPIDTTSMFQNKDSIDMDVVEDIQNDFSDDDINMAEIDSIIENAEILKSNVENTYSPMLIRDPQPFITNPRLTGAPGMVIDLDGGDPFAPKKLTGVELLKERFTYFAKLKTPEEMERDREKKLKPGNLHLKLKQELEEKMADQRSIEWAKRLEEEKQHQMELNALRGDASEEEDEIEKIESKLEEDYVEPTENPSESEEELPEDDICIKDKPRTNNPMVDDEAEESDCGDDNDEVANNVAANDGDSDDDDDAGDSEESSDESSDEESSESENEETKPKKGRILKAFEDSDDEDESTELNEQDAVTESGNKASGSNKEDNTLNEKQMESQAIKDSQDDELQLAQRYKSLSGDLFTSQESALVTPTEKVAPTPTDNIMDDDKDLGSQTFSILNSTTKDNIEIEQHCTEKLSVVCTTQPYDDNLDAVAVMCLGNFTQNLVNTQLPITQVSQSQPIGEDILALCTGQFYDNQFVSPADENINDITQESSIDDNCDEEIPKASLDNVQQINNHVNTRNEDVIPELYQEDTKDKDGNLLKSILDELDEPDIDSPKVNKFFKGNTQKKDNDKSVSNVLSKKKFIIDSDDETNETTDSSVRKKKLKKKKPEKRALQISDDEDELELEEEEVEDYMSDIEDDTNRMVEYDSEENEVEIKPQNPKKKRKATDFFEQEAELTSEDEWVGSGDEDEADLDQMEREEGDDDTFHQGKLQRELGQIHMRDVLDQDKREVRIIQELMFEDGDLGEGHRQRKFRWRNTDGEEETGTIPDEFADTQEEEFESEEQWRKERHEREIFLRQLKDPDEAEENPNTTVNRTSIIKANLMSKTMSSLLMEVNNSDTSKAESPVVAEKKTATDIPSPKKPFVIFKQSYHGSLLTRGRGALARLAAIATPLAVDDNDAPKVGSLAPTNRRNFVFAAVTPDNDKPKVTKRKADVNVNVPRLVKKMKTEEKPKYQKSLLEQLKV